MAACHHRHEKNLTAGRRIGEVHASGRAVPCSVGAAPCSVGAVPRGVRVPPCIFEGQAPTVHE
eukprot:360539-Chlamydomonas_euryale.AAC.8